MGEMTMGRAGDVAWSTDPVMGITVREGDEAAAVHRLFGIQRLAPWRELYTGAKVEERSTVEGRPVTIITMTPAVGASERWSIDDASGLLARVSTSLPDPMGGQIAMDWVFDDWKSVKGILFPHVRRQEVGTMKIVYRVESVAVNGEVDPSRVAPDDDVKEAIEDPKRRTKKAPSAGTFEIETLTKTPALAIRATIKPADVSSTLASLLPEVFTFAGKSGAQIGGPPFTRFHRVDEDSIELEAGIPVREAVAGEGRIKAIELPAGRAVVTWHIGPYPELPKTYESLKTWMTKNDARSRDAFWEVYWTDPGLEPDPGKWRTQIVWPIE
jgi:effector-binding domain-containing protein